MPGSRGLAFLLLALAMLFWAGNWVLGRALRAAFEPFTLNFLRWALATLILAPFALPALRAQAGVVRRHAGILVLLALAGVSLFHAMVYLGLRTTTTVNAILLNSSLPLFILACSWVLERERSTLPQVGGMLLSACTRCCSSAARPRSAAWASCS
jgi:drug/metabolite transporter (DMT)-like permease